MDTITPLKTIRLSGYNRQNQTPNISVGFQQSKREVKTTHHEKLRNEAMNQLTEVATINKCLQDEAKLSDVVTKDPSKRYPFDCKHRDQTEVEVQNPIC